MILVLQKSLKVIYSLLINTVFFYTIGADDAPRYPTGNLICIVLNIVAIFLFISQRVRYTLTNKYREKEWNSMSDADKEIYNKTTKHKGNDRLDYRFRI